MREGPRGGGRHKDKKRGTDRHERDRDVKGGWRLRERRQRQAEAQRHRGDREDREKRALKTETETKIQMRSDRAGTGRQA